MFRGPDPIQYFADTLHECDLAKTRFVLDVLDDLEVGRIKGNTRQGRGAAVLIVVQL